MVIYTNSIRKSNLKGHKLINEYVLLNELGRGVHGKVKLVHHKETKELYAMKILNRTLPKRLTNALSQFKMNQNDYLNKILHEIRVWSKLSHPHIVNLIEVIDDKTSSKLYLILEYMEGGELEWCENGLPIYTESECKLIFRDIVSGLMYLHSSGIIHRDIKPANMLWSSEDRIKITDFGVSVDLEKLDTEEASNMIRKTAGSPAFFAPEMCLPAKSNNLNYNDSTLNTIEKGRAIDVWALGVTLYCLLFGKLPYHGVSEFDLFHKIANNPVLLPPPITGSEENVNRMETESNHSVDVQVDFEHPQIKNNICKWPQIPISIEGIDLLSGLLEKDPTKRWNLEKIVLHPWTLSEMLDEERQDFLMQTNHPETLKSAPTREKWYNSMQNLFGQVRKSSIWKKSMYKSKEKRGKSKVEEPIDMGYLPLSVEHKAREIQETPSQPIAAEWSRWKPNQSDEK